MDKGYKDPLYGNYRAQVVNNKDKEQYGRVMVWIPDLMPDIEPVKGIWARPANNPLGGRNSQSSYSGTSYIPETGSWTWVFFEAGNINRPYYFGALDIENTKVLAENQVGSSYQSKWTIIKSASGRAIVVSDDADDARVEITGKKRLLEDPPSGDQFSVYRIDENQNTILLDERTETEKFLIKTHTGDFIKLSIKDGTLEILVSDDIEIKSGGHILVTSSGDQHFLAGGNMYLTAGAGMHLLAGGSITCESGDEYNVKCGGASSQNIGASKIVQVGETCFVSAVMEHHTQAGVLIARDAAQIDDNSGASQPPPAAAIDAVPATSADPVGDRDSS